MDFEESINFVNQWRNNLVFWKSATNSYLGRTQKVTVKNSFLLEENGVITSHLQNHIALNFIFDSLHKDKNKIHSYFAI